MRVTIIGSGSKGNSTLIEFKNKRILIDIGFNYKHIKEQLQKIKVYPKDIDYIIISHEHSDHIKGLKVFLNKNNPKIYVNNLLYKDIEYIKNYANKENLENDIENEEFKIVVLNSSHDAINPKYFVIEDKIAKESLAYITDTGYINNRNFKFLKNKNYYILESNHDEEMLRKGTYPDYLQRRILSDIGHLSNRTSAIYFAKLIGDNTKKLVLAHLSDSNNTEEFALATYKKILEEYDIEFNNIRCAKQNEMVEI